MERLVKQKQQYKCWLNYSHLRDHPVLGDYKQQLTSICVLGEGLILKTVEKELSLGLAELLGEKPVVQTSPESDTSIVAGVNYLADERLQEEGYIVKAVEVENKVQIVISSPSERGLLYGAFAFLRELQGGKNLETIDLLDNPKNPLRMLNHWDNFDGSIERGYAGKSFFYDNNKLTGDLGRVEDYARMLASIGINAVAINNVNVHALETTFIDSRLDVVKTIADIFRPYGISVFVSINFASPMEIGGLDTADPLDEKVQQWWSEQTAKVYEQIPDLGGYLVKADSEFRPGPFTYGRDHADGANLLGRALKPFGGILIWRCFVYNCQQDWRDHKTDRARAAYDVFYPLDGKFDDNVILQIKNGPMDFQVREPVSPLFGALQRTNQMLELQITQEYTGQQRHLCYLIPQWKEILDFDTYAKGPGSTVDRIISGELIEQSYSGITAVVNVGRDLNWTGHTLAQANLYGYGRLAWDPNLSAEEITREWILGTFGHNDKVMDTVAKMLLESWEVYEKYTVPLGIGWMCNINHHYGPSPEGYEYSKWGTYHRANHEAIGVDRSVKNGTGYAGQYFPENAEMYENVETCPEELLLFFHRIPYTYKLKSGKTLIQNVYDTHFEGVEQVEEMIKSWQNLQGLVEQEAYEHILDRLRGQLVDAQEWRDVINNYFYRKSGIPDEKNRKIY